MRVRRCATKPKNAARKSIGGVGCVDDGGELAAEAFAGAGEGVGAIGVRAIGAGHGLAAGCSGAAGVGAGGAASIGGGGGSCGR